MAAQWHQDRMRGARWFRSDHVIIPPFFFALSLPLIARIAITNVTSIVVHSYLIHGILPPSGKPNCEIVRMANAVRISFENERVRGRCGGWMHKVCG